MQARDIHRRDFLTQHHLENAAVAALPGDASRRHYFRITRPDGTSCLLMDVPPHPEEKFHEFLLVARHLRRLGLSAPEVYAVNDADGFALIEDFGEDTFTRLLNNGHDAEPLYRGAILASAILQRQTLPQDMPLPHYDTDAMTGEISWFIQWYAPMYWGRAASADELASFTAAVRNVFDGLPALPTTLLLRDFHVDNLMRVAGREGVAACGILDFQDAKWGSPAYDLVSILEDARRDTDPALTQTLYDAYLSLRGDLDKDAFAAHYAAMGMLRHARILGNFVRLWVRDDKPRYLEFMPRVTAQFLRALAHPIAAPLREWCNQYLPNVGQAWPERDIPALRAALMAA